MQIDKRKRRLVVRPFAHVVPQYGLGEDRPYSDMLRFMLAQIAIEVGSRCDRVRDVGWCGLERKQRPAQRGQGDETSNEGDGSNPDPP